MNDGPNVNLWDALAVAVWLVAIGLITYDAITYDGVGMGPVTPYGGLAALLAAVLTTAGVARRSKEEIIAVVLSRQADATPIRKR